MFSQYFAATAGSDEEREQFSLLKLAVEGVWRRHVLHGADGGNEDLLHLIQEAKKFGVRVFPAKSIISYRVSSRDEDEYRRQRCRIANYGTAEIIKTKMLSNFVVLYGNGHLMKTDQRKMLGKTSAQDRNIPLQQMIGAKAIAFQGGLQISSVAPDVLCCVDFADYQARKDEVLEKVLGGALVSPATSPATPRKKDLLAGKGNEGLDQSFC